MGYKNLSSNTQRKKKKSTPFLLTKYNYCLRKICHFETGQFFQAPIFIKNNFLQRIV